MLRIYVTCAFHCQKSGFTRKDVESRVECVIDLTNRRHVMIREFSDKYITKQTTEQASSHCINGRKL